MNPLYSSEVKADDPALAGDWLLDANQPPVAQVHPSPLPGAPWTVTITDNGASEKYLGYLLRLADSLFIELTPENSEGLPHNALLPPAPHSFYQLQLTGDTVLVSPIDPQWLEKHLRHDQFEKHQTDRRETQLVILNSTEELQAFLRLHAADSSAFPIAIPLTRNPPGRQNGR